MFVILQDAILKSLLIVGLETGRVFEQSGDSNDRLIQQQLRYICTGEIPDNRCILCEKGSWASRRFWLQEDLTRYIGETISRIADTKDVYVKLENLVHGCEKFRGAQAKNGNLTTEYKNGIFKREAINV